MALSPVQLQDCMSIVKSFEHGAQFAMTEESVFAVMSGRLDAMRSMSTVVKNSMEDKSAGSNQANLKDSGNPAASVATAVNGQMTGDVERKDTIASKIRECVPCKTRVNFKEKFDILSLLDPTSAMNEFAGPVNKAFKDYFKRALSEINEFLDMFNNLDKYVDLCAFRKFLTENVCIPDLQRMLALLSAYLMKIAMGLNSSFSTIVSLFGGLLMPFLSSIIDTLMKFIMAAVKPMECIIESIQRFMSKLDYNVLFQNIDNMKVSVGPKKGQPERPSDVKLPLVGTVAKTQDPAVNYDKRGRWGEVDLAAGQRAVLNSQQEDVDTAQDELDALQEASTKIDGADQDAADKNRQQITQAKQKLSDAKQKKNTSAVGRANQGITEKFSAMKGSLVSLVGTLRTAIEEFENYVRKVVDELTKLVNEFGGTGGNQAAQLGSKLQTIQLIALIAAIIKAIKAKSVCADEGEAVDQVLNQLNDKGEFNIWTDDDGTIHIDEDGNAAIEDIAKAFGLGPSQNLNSLIQFTGDKLLDSGISRAVDSLTNPRRVKFKCALQTSVANAEQVNKWMAELDEDI